MKPDELIYTNCDECGHPAASHTPDLEHPTCWAESRCADCNATELGRLYALTRRDPDWGIEDERAAD